MNTTLLVNISGTTYEQVDIFEDIPIQLVIQQSDLTDVTSRRTPYSKVVQLPGTNNNDKIFEHYFEVNGTDFNPLNKVPCVVQYRGTDIFRGVLRLNGVIQNKYNRIYEVYMLGVISDVASEMRNYNLQELNWTDLVHERNYDNVVLSWEAKSINQDGLLNGDILYPLVNYGLKYQGDSTVPAFQYDFDTTYSFGLSGYPATIDTFKPSIRLKKVIDTIFDTIGFEYESDFFNSNYFKSIYMDMFQNGQLGIETASAVTNQNIFLVGNPQFRFRYKANTRRLLNFFDYLPGAYDPLDNWKNQYGGYLVPYQGDYFFNFRVDPKLYDLTMIASIEFEAWKSTDPTDPYQTQIWTSPPVVLDLLTNPPQNYFFSATCSPGEYIFLNVRETLPPIYIGLSSNRGEYGLLPFKDLNIQDSFVSFDLYNSPLLSGTDTVDVSLGIQNVNAFDFFKSLIVMFNLVVLQDPDTGKVKIEPYNWYYNDDDRPKKNWTQKIDTDSDMKIEPLSFDLKKELKWTNLDTENEYLNKLFFDRNDHVFGRYKFTSTNNILTGEDQYETIFGSTPTEGIKGAPNFVIPKFYYLNNGLETPYSTQPHLFFYTGNRYAYKDIYKSEQGLWYLLSGTTPVSQTTYPCVSHISNLDIQIPELVSDLNFVSTFDFYGNNNNQIIQFTPYDLYSTFWSDYIENVYSPETRRLSCKVFMTPLDIYDISLKDKMFIKDTFYTIEKINEANLVDRKLTDITFIKDRLPYYKIVPPSPVYSISGNTPYPGVEPIFYTNCYVSSEKDDVCNGTATIETVYTFGFGTLQDFDKVYYDTGTQYKLYTKGTYIRQTSSSDLYVVADIYGRIITQYC